MKVIGFKLRFLGYDYELPGYETASEKSGREKSKQTQKTCPRPFKIILWNLSVDATLIVRLLKTHFLQRTLIVKSQLNIIELVARPATIQGFIIDAFGALRDQMQGVEDELENNCFICGIGKDYLDKVPHGFDIHVEKEHNLANYLFFLMYLINKDETEYTGQETYVWNSYKVSTVKGKLFIIKNLFLYHFFMKNQQFLLFTFDIVIS